ncbi:hypothetical protein N478_18310 [Pseudoalteromonas luteoviolacea S4060-1]|uniref:Uncharacterized protein n=1 Tax=Pseudoalteromonas luteoviolacea S4060-1 TaxID=1365257 RepID=A0A167MQM1_9GAMM|nr:hypothetical protein N478_18310 [Pseudoalteromonas luteoviolacea S4060-1]
MCEQTIAALAAGCTTNITIITAISISCAAMLVSFDVQGIFTVIYESTDN